MGYPHTQIAIRLYEEILHCSIAYGFTYEHVPMNTRNNEAIANGRIAINRGGKAYRRRKHTS